MFICLIQVVEARETRIKPFWRRESFPWCWQNVNRKRG